MEYKISKSKLIEMLDLMGDGWIEYEITEAHDWLCVCLIDSKDTEKAKDFYFDAVH